MRKSLHEWLGLIVLSGISAAVYALVIDWWEHGPSVTEWICR